MGKWLWIRILKEIAESLFLEQAPFVVENHEQGSLVVWVVNIPGFSEEKQMAEKSRGIFGIPQKMAWM